MTEPNEARLNKLRQNLRARGNRLSPAMNKLARAALGESEDGLTHQECIDALPAYVDLELANERVAAKFPRVKRHLDTCDDCSAQYAELLETALAAQEGRIPTAVTTPAPDLSFLTTLPDFVKQIAAKILAAIAPNQVPDLSVISEVFFERINTLGGKFVLQPSAIRELGFDSGELSEALVTLAVTYAATQAIIASLAPNEIDALAAQNHLCEKIEELARTAARSVQGEPALSQRIAGQFATRVCADPTTLRVLIEHSIR